MSDSEKVIPSAGVIETSLNQLSLSDATQTAEVLAEGDPTTVPVQPTECEEHAEQKAVIRKALDQQTQLLYEQYAQEQHPKDPQKQKELVFDMQEQYFARYLSENHQSQLLHQRQQIEQRASLCNQAGGDKEEEKSANVIGQADWPLIPAIIWTRKDISDFKQEIMRTQRECCIKIGSLSTATIRVPTHPEGSAVFWEFATDHYDLGFGLYFEWDLEPPTTVSVNISESSDEDDLDDDEEDGEISAEARLTGESGDVECGRRNDGSQAPLDELIPIYRRDCHTEVYCGSHSYPGTGVYIFKFDNSFSLWRSKWLYYRIYYTQ